jgi:hypothetical protein
MSERQIPDTAIGPPRPSGADFFLPQRGSKSLDAAKVRIVRRFPSHGKDESSGGSGKPSGG